MDLDPQTVTALTRLSEADQGTVVTTHGLIDQTPDSPRLTEPTEDYSEDRFPISLPLTEVPEVADEAYAIVRGTLRADEGRLMSYDALTLEVDAIDPRGPSLEEHADITSRGEAYKAIDNIISEFSDPIPRRYIIEMAIERGVTRDTTKDVLRRMETAGNIYEPDVGRVGGM